MQMNKKHKEEMSEQTATKPPMLGEKRNKGLALKQMHQHVSKNQGGNEGKSLGEWQHDGANDELKGEAKRRRKRMRLLPAEMTAKVRAAL